MSQLSTLDANQVIKTVYDPSSGGFKMVPAAVSDTVWVSSIPGNAASTFPAVQVISYRVMGITVTWSGLNGSGSTLTFQGSTNGVNYFNIGSVYTIATASGAEGFSVIDEPYQYVQIVFNPGSSTAGTLSADYILRA
jgi:hypothetical protein